jgi:hypothetical protein
MSYYDEELRRMRAQSGVLQPFSPVDMTQDQGEGPGFFSEVVRGIGAGVEGAVQDVYGLLDTVAFDALPNYDNRLIDRPTTMAGGLTEGLTNFMVGFLPVVGWLGKGAKLGRTMSLAPKLSKTAQAAATARGATGTALAIDVARGATAGAIADFAVWDGHEERLSDLLQAYPFLANPVSEFLQADENDHEIEGRLKTAVEGLMLGGVIDLARFMLHYRAGIRARAGGATPQQTQAAADAAVPTDELVLAYGGKRNRPKYSGDRDYSFAELVFDEDKMVKDKTTGEMVYAGTKGMLDAPSGLSKKEQLDSIQSLLTEASRGGEIGKDWYEKSGQEILRIAGGSVEEADKIAQLVAIYSAGTGVETNLEFALQAYYRSKRLTREQFLSKLNKTGSKGKYQMEFAARILYDGEWFGDITQGLKTRNFYNDLMSGIDPTRSTPNGSTQDMWMARLFGFMPERPSGPINKPSWKVEGNRYHYMMRQVKQVADQLGWKPHQVQAASWAYAKTLWESMTDEVVEAASKQGIARDSYEFATLYQKMFNKRLKSEVGGNRLHKVTETYDLTSVLKNKSIILPDDALPSQNSGILDGLHGADYATKVEYLGDMEILRTGGVPDGDVIAEALGFGTRSGAEGGARMIPSPTARPGGIASVEAAAAKGQSGYEPISRAQAEAYAMTEGLYHGRAEVQGIQMTPAGQREFLPGGATRQASGGTKAAVANGFEINFGRLRSDSDLETIQNAVRSVFDDKAVAVPLPRGFAVVRRSNRLNKGKFVTDSRKLLDALELKEADLSGRPIIADHFQIKSGTADGSGFRKMLEDRGHAKALEQLDDVYGPNVARVQQKYAARGFGEVPGGVPSRAPDVAGQGSRASARSFDKNATELVGLDGTPVPTNADGTITLFHRTNRDAADRIAASGQFVRGADGSTYFSTRPDGAAAGYGDVIVEVRVDPKHVELDDAFRNGEVHVSVAEDALTNIKVTDGGAPLIPRADQLAAAKTSTRKSKTAVGDAAARLARDLPEDAEILDFGAGKLKTDAAGNPVVDDLGFPAEHYHNGLMRDGKNVTLHDFEANRTSFHDPDALTRQYDMVTVSNVINVQSSKEMLDTTMRQIHAATKDGGSVIMNLPGKPRRPGVYPKGMSRKEQAEYLRDYLKQYFGRVEVVDVRKLDENGMPRVTRADDGVPSEPVFLLRDKLAEPHYGNIVRPYPSFFDLGRVRSRLQDLYELGPIREDWPNLQGPQVDKGLKKASRVREDTLIQVYGKKGPAAARAIQDEKVTAAIIQKEAGGTILKIEVSQPSFYFPGKKYAYINELPDGSLIYFGSGRDAFKNIDLPRKVLGGFDPADGKTYGKKRAQIYTPDEAVTQGARDVADALLYREGARLRHYGDHIPDGAPSYIADAGAEQIIERLRLELFKNRQAVKGLDKTLDVAGAARNPELNRNLHPRRIHTLERFVREIGEDFFSVVKLRVLKPDSMVMGGAGEYNFLSGLIHISQRAIDKGELERTVLHELWHHLSSFVDNGVVQRLNKQYLKERKAWIAKNPTEYEKLLAGQFTLDSYRWTNFDEWFAEVMTDKSLARYADKLPEPELTVLQYARKVFGRMMSAIQRLWGPDHATKVFNNFFEGKVPPIEVKGLPLEMRLNNMRPIDINSPGVAPMTRAYLGGGATPSGAPRGPRVQDMRPGLLRGLGIDEQTAQNILSVIDNRIQLPNQKINPREVVTDPVTGGQTYKYTKADLLDAELERNDLNLAHLYGSDDAFAVMRTFESLYRSVMEADVPNLSAKSFDEQLERSRAELVDLIGLPPKSEQAFQMKLMADIAQDNKMIARINARVLAYKRLAITYGEFLAKEAAEVAAGQNSDKALAQFIAHAEFNANLIAGIKGVLSEQGRGLGANRIPLEGIISDPKQLANFMQMHGGRAKGKRLADLILHANKAGGLGAANKLTQTSGFSTAMNVLNEYWINSILSGGKTLFVNGLGGVMMSIYRPLEAMLGASLTLNGSKFADAASELAHLFSSASESWKFAWVAMKNGENILDPAAKIMDTSSRRAITPEALRMNPDSYFAPGVRWMGNVIRVPSSILTGTDEFFKQLNYRARARRALTREAIDNGLKGNDIAAHVHDRMEQLIENGQAYSISTAYKRGVEDAKAKGFVDPVEIREYAQQWIKQPSNFDTTLNTISERGLEYAEEITFTKALAEGSISAGLQRMAVQHPMLRFVFPFVRTPMNIAMEAGGRLAPYPAVTKYAFYKFTGKNMDALRTAQSKTIRQLSSGDKGEIAEVAGRLAAGAGAIFIVGQKAMEGVVTGRGPADPEMRNLLKETGWQPYSIKTSEGYVSYQRMDPFATILGTIADIADYTRYAPLEEQEDGDTVLMGIGVAMANNFTNKTYLAGLANMLEAVQDPDRFMPKLARTYGASMLPFSSFMGQSVHAAGDDALRDVQSFHEALMAKTPYMSENVRPLRNVLGEPVKRVTSLGSKGVHQILDMFVPIAYSEVSDDAIKNEMANLGHGFTPPKPVKNGIRLTEYINPTNNQDAYDRWGELTGKVKVRGRNLRAALNKLIRSPQYKRLSPISTFETDSPRITEIKKVIEVYKRAAFTDMLREYPDLAANYSRIENDSRLLMRGIDPR